MTPPAPAGRLILALKAAIKVTRMKPRLLLWTLLPLVLLAACSAPTGSPAATPSAKAALTHVRLPVGYVPDIQFAPLYMAVERGYYRQAEIEIEFDYKLENDGVALVGAGTVPFAVASGEQVLLARAQGLPVVYVLAWYQDYPVAVIAKAAEGIKTPADLRGKKIGIPCLCGASYVGLRALLAAGGLRESDVTLEVIGFNQIAALTAGQEDAVVGYTSNEPVELRASGVAIDVLKVSDYAHLAGNGIITNEATLQQNPALVRGMVTATLQGMRDTMANPQQAYEVSKKYVQGLASADAALTALKMQVLVQSIALWQANRLGWIDAEAWTATDSILRDTGQLTQPLDVHQAISNEFIP